MFFYRYNSDLLDDWDGKIPMEKVQPNKETKKVFN